MKNTPISFDLRSIGRLVYIPIFFNILAVLLSLVRYGDFTYDANFLEQVMREIKMLFGVINFPFISVWIFALYQDVVESDGKEGILSLPYRNLYFGTFRVIRVILIYSFIFYCAFLFVIVTLFGHLTMLTVWDWLLPILSFVFYGALSFLFIVLTRRVALSYIALGLHTIPIYMTRGGISFSIYPFQWSHPNPYFNDGNVAFFLLIFSILFFLIAQRLLGNREFILK